MSAMSLWCQPCDHYFKAGTFPMDVRELRRLTKTTKCPKCGAGSKTLFLKPEPTPENTKPEQDPTNPFAPLDNKGWLE